MAKVFGGSFALLDLPVAQRTFGKEGKLDIVDLTIEEGQSIDAVQERLRDRLKGAAEVERPRKRGEQIEQLLTSFRVGLFFVSLIALFVGFFLIYNTVVGFGDPTKERNRHPALPGHETRRAAALDRRRGAAARAGRLDFRRAARLVARSRRAGGGRRDRR